LCLLNKEEEEEERVNPYFQYIAQPYSPRLSFSSSWKQKA
jgi:hypothetical protein